MPNPIQLHAKGLFLPLRTTFKQASSVRNQGESIWCAASRNEHTGYGEGCPRIYVTDETVKTGLKWLDAKMPTIANQCLTLDHLRIWISDHQSEIDQHPAAFCAVETALLDLFAKEKEQSVEALLGLASPKHIYSYTAVLGDSSIEKFNALAQRYLSMGFLDFKIKVNGNFPLDQQKLNNLKSFCTKNKVSNYRIRLDANNLWTHKTEEAINYLAQLPKPIFGVEEPIAPKNYTALSKISTSLNLPIILDESLCNINDLENILAVSGKFIANLKVSKVGGVLRALSLVKTLKQSGHLIIIGAHVGETSILTRAAMCVAQTAKPNLIAQEGGFGLILLEKDMVTPSLMFGAGGIIDLTKPIPSQETETPFDNQWNKGWGVSFINA